MHSRPLSDDDPDIAPDAGAAARSADATGRTAGQHPGVARASSSHVRGDLLDQPYLTLFEKPDTLLDWTDARELRLLSYNIRHGGVGRVEAIAAVIRGCAPDLVVLQEATRPDVVRSLAEAAGDAASRRAAADARSAS